MFRAIMELLGLDIPPLEGVVQMRFLMTKKRTLEMMEFVEEFVDSEVLEAVQQRTDKVKIARMAKVEEMKEVAAAVVQWNEMKEAVAVAAKVEEMKEAAAVVAAAKAAQWKEMAVAVEEMKEAAAVAAKAAQWKEMAVAASVEAAEAVKRKAFVINAGSQPS